MEDKRRSDTFKSPLNPLLSVARGGFSLDDIGGSPLLVPVSENSSSVLPNDVGVAAAAAPPSGPALEPSATYGGFASSVSSFTSSLFATPAPGPPAASSLEDTFQAVPLEPATGPTPTFYNPLLPHQPRQTPSPFSEHVGVPPPSGLSVGPPSGLSVGLPSELSVGPPSGLSVGPPSDPSLGPQFGLSVGPPSGLSLGTPSDLSLGPQFGRSAGPPSDPSRGPQFGLSVGPPSGLPGHPPGLSVGPPSGLPSHPPGLSVGPPSGLPSHPPGLSVGPPSGLPSHLPGLSVGPPSGLPSHPTGLPVGPPSARLGPSPGLPPGPQLPTQGAANAFRLGGRRPVYAPVPGLETSSTPAAPAAPAAPSQQHSMAMAQTQMMPTSPSPAPTPPGVLATLPAFPAETFNNGDQQVASSPLDYSPPPMYRTVYQHWFFKREVESKVLWQPFSMSDSLALETQFLSPDLTIDTEVPTDGGRYDVNILRRQRAAVYWEEAPTEVRRCSWFYKNQVDSRYVPYDENVATRLEEEYKQAYTLNEWQKRVEFPNGESVVFHSANAMVHYLASSSPDAWGNTPVSSTTYTDGTQHRPRVVKRGVDEFDIESGESETVDHLLFLVHGIGSACDLKFRSVVEVVDDFRSVSQQLVESHFSASVESGKARRIEVLPVSWHARLHSEDLERQLRSITLPSIPRLRHLTNDALIDILFYTSPIYCQTIIQTVAKELNRLHELFLKRNPGFRGGVSLGGHSLGSLILFDLLWHQKSDLLPTTPTNSPSTPPLDEPETNPDNGIVADKDVLTKGSSAKRKLSHKISYVMMGPAGTGQPFISYPQLAFHPENFFALGSPIGVFVTVRGIDSLGEDFVLPTCPAFFNIFHPYDLVAYRIETLIKADMENIPPVLIPHHKGRKRMHLELKETVARMGADLKQKVLDSVRNTWNSVYQMAMFHRTNENLTEEMNQVLEDEIRQQSISECSNSSETDADTSIIIGKLNGGRRIDYVLQEAPLESFNEYIFAIGSHVCYWKSEDTMLLMLKEMYRSVGVNVDSQVPQQQVNSPVGLASPASPTDSFASFSQSLSPSEPALLEPSPLFPTPSHSSAQQNLGMDPTAPPSDNSRIVGPPPVTGFYRK